MIIAIWILIGYAIFLLLSDAARLRGMGEIGPSFEKILLAEGADPATIRLNVFAHFALMVWCWPLVLLAMGFIVAIDRGWLK